MLIKRSLVSNGREMKVFAVFVTVFASFCAYVAWEGFCMMAITVIGLGFLVHVESLSIPSSASNGNSNNPNTTQIPRET